MTSADRVRPSLLLLGHRGARAYAAENTIPAFDLSLQHGCDGIEFDVRLTADRHAVICHDPSLGPPGSGIEIASASMARCRQAASQSGYELPTLAEVLLRYGSSAFLDIELKVAGAEEIVIAALAGVRPTKGFVVSSFFPEILFALRGRQPDLPLGWICDDPQFVARWPELPVDSLVLHHTLVTPEMCRDIHQQNKQLMVWTVNDAAQMTRFAAMGVDGIISDDTQLLGDTLGRH